MSDTVPEDGDVVESPSPEPTVEAPAAPPPVSDGPWSKELASTFEDAATRASVDEFLRGTVQPHVTKLEQATVTNRDAVRLWDDFANDPTGTYAAVTRELFGDDVAERITEAVSGEDWAEDDPGQLEPDEADTGEYPPEIQELIQERQAARARDAFDSELARVAVDHPDIKINEELFYPFVVAADGDFDAAAEAYSQHVSTIQSEYGISVPSPETVVTPPPVISNTNVGTSVPPQQEKYETLDDALDSFFAEQNSAPPVVGG